MRMRPRCPGLILSSAVLLLCQPHEPNVFFLVQRLGAIKQNRSGCFAWRPEFNCKYRLWHLSPLGYRCWHPSVGCQTDSPCHPPPQHRRHHRLPPAAPLRWWSLAVVRIRIRRGSWKHSPPLRRTPLPRTPREASTYRTGFLGFGSVSHLNKQCRRWRRVNGVKKKLSIRQRDTSTR